MAIDAQGTGGTGLGEPQHGGRRLILTKVPYGPTLHEQGTRFIEEDHPIMFSDHPDQVDVPSKAGSLVLADGRVLHAAYRNLTAQRRDLLLIWHSRPETVPDWWDREVPRELAERGPESEYERTRIPGAYLR